MDYLPTIAQHGLLGVLLALALVVIYFLYRENKTLQEKRINDLLQTRDAYMHAIDGIKQTSDLILSLLQGRRRP